MAAAVTDDVRASGDVDLGAVCWRRTLQRRRTDVDPVTTGVCGSDPDRRRQRVRQSACSLTVAPAAGAGGETLRRRRLVDGGRRTTVDGRRRRARRRHLHRVVLN